jgi:hypothetical protein
MEELTVVLIFVPRSAGDGILWLEE